MPSLTVTLAQFAARLLPASVKRLIYRVDPLARLIRRSLNRSLSTELHDTTISGGELAGMKMALNLQTDKSFWLGTYENDLLDSLQRVITPGMTVYDVGANIGYVSLFLARLVGPAGHVYSFEPLPENLERLRRNVSLNGLEAAITVVPMAVADRDRTVEFLIAPSGSMGKVSGSGGYADGFVGTISIPATSLDQYVYDRNMPAPSVMKLDIEGGEVLALPGMKRVLETARPIVFIELHGHDSARTAWDTLTGAGYTLSQLNSPGRPLQSCEQLDWRTYVVATPASHA